MTLQERSKKHDELVAKAKALEYAPDPKTPEVITEALQVVREGMENAKGTRMEGYWKGVMARWERRAGK